MKLRAWCVWVIGWSWLLVADLRGQAAFPGADDKWRHYQSPNFELYSRNPGGMSRELLHDLETLRAFFLETFKLTERRRMEVTVYYFNSSRDFLGYIAGFYGKNKDIGGFYSDSIDRALICLPASGSETGNRQVIFHEYIHHLFRTSEQIPPLWFNEGTAELFATVTPTGDGKKLEFGHPAPHRLYAVQTQKLMPLEKLFAVDGRSPVMQNDGHAGLFYAQSWALMHYLYFGDSKIPADKRSQFVNMAIASRFEDAEKFREAFREVFAMDYPEMQERLERYLRNGKYFTGKVPRPAVAAPKSYAMRGVARQEIETRLAEMDLRVSRSPRAKLALLQAVERDPADLRSWEALGAEALRDGSEVVARERWERAVSGGTRNPVIYRELGLMEGRTVFARFDPYYRLPPDKAARLREYLTRSIAYNPEQTPAYEMLAWVEAFAPEPSIPNLSLIQKKYQGLTRRERTALALAFVRVRLNLPDEALEILAGLETMQPDDWEVYGIEAMRAFIEKRPINPDKLRAVGPAGATRIPIAPPRIKAGS